MNIKKSTAVLLLAFASVFIFAREVNRKELESASSKNVIEFENYTGPHSKIDSRSAIKGIGKTLGSLVASDVTREGTYSASGAKYYVIHAIDEEQKDKLDADILFISQDAGVDHIRNLRWIISSYLQEAYAYEESDADTIATFITVYNAVYRGKISVFRAKYKDVVLSHLSEDKCGISTKWNEWAGNTQLVIPLNDVNGGLSTIETSVISDKQVVQSMKEEDNKGIDERKNMVNIKEREAETAAQKAQDAQKQAAEEKQKVKELEKAAEEAKKDAEEHPADKEKQLIAEKKQEEIEEQQEIIKELEEEASEQQAVADKKQNEAQLERREIASDQEKLIQEEIAEKSIEAAVIGLRVTDKEKGLSGLVKINAATGAVIRESPVSLVRGRTIYSTDTLGTAEAATKYIAICGENVGNGAIKLCVLDGYKMEIQRESNESVSENSVLVQSGDNYYCVIANNGSWTIGKYDSSLKLLLKSPAAVADDTPITVTSYGVVVTDSEGKVILLRLDDLVPVSKTNANHFPQNDSENE